MDFAETGMPPQPRAKLRRHRAHSRRLNQHGIAHRYKEFPDNDTGIDYRMHESLPFLA